MAERQVTVDTERFSLSPEFFVIATQNPVDQHGTYPLPEAQLDRFAMKLSIGYPATDDEILMLQEAVGVTEDATPDESSILSAGQLRGLQQQVAGISVAKKVQEYLVRIATETRRHASIALGLSPRGLLTLQRAAQARAFLSERGYVTPDDVLDVVEPVLGVRLGLELVEANRVIQDVLEAVAVPEYSENVK
jgi:MoxR-like ATPase